MEIQGKPVGVISFLYYNHNNEINDTILISLRTKKIIKSKVRINRDGKGGRSYRLFSAKYLMYTVRKDPVRKQVTVAVIKLKVLEAGYQVRFLRQWKSVDRLPKQIREILDVNKDQLPFYM